MLFTGGGKGVCVFPAVSEGTTVGAACKWRTEKLLIIIMILALIIGGEKLE